MQKIRRKLARRGRRIRGKVFYIDKIIAFDKDELALGGVIGQ